MSWQKVVLWSVAIIFGFPVVAVVLFLLVSALIWFVTVGVIK